jgi:hypothetical protein
VFWPDLDAKAFDAALEIRDQGPAIWQRRRQEQRVSVSGLADKGRRSPSVNQSDLLVRSASAAVLLALALGAAYLGGVAAGIVVAIFAVIVHLEWARMTGATTARAIPFAAAIALAVVLAGLGMVPVAIGVGVVAALVAAGISREPWLPRRRRRARHKLLAIRVSSEYGLPAARVAVFRDHPGAFFGRLIDQIVATHLAQEDVGQSGGSSPR